MWIGCFDLPSHWVAAWRPWAGGLAVDILGLSPSFAIQYLVFFLIVVAVGGLGTIKGTFVAALVLGVIDNGGKYLWPEGGAFFIYAITIVILLLKPTGLYGRDG